MTIPSRTDNEDSLIIFTLVLLDACNLTIHIGLIFVFNSWLTNSRFVYGPVIIRKIRQRNLHPSTSISRSIVPVMVLAMGGGGRGLVGIDGLCLDCHFPTAQSRLSNLSMAARDYSRYLLIATAPATSPKDGKRYENPYELS